MKKKDLSAIVLVGVFFIGLSVLLYPAISDYWNSYVQSKAVANYESVVSDMSDERAAELLKEAEQYNAKLAQLNYPLVHYRNVAGYNQILNVSGDGIIGYITIEKIKVELPIYHGTSTAVLNIAAGHLEGSSIPIGGGGTHAVISAHRGLPSAKLFTNLDKLEVGDTFRITVLNKAITYCVDQISVVEPNEVSRLQIEDGQDYCTLLTCTPYGINTHRLLVRGTRVENAKDKPIVYITSEAFKIDPLVAAPVVAAPILLILFIYLLVKYRTKNKAVPDGKEKTDEKVK